MLFLCVLACFGWFLLFDMIFGVGLVAAFLWVGIIWEVVHFWCFWVSFGFNVFGVFGCDVLWVLYLWFLWVSCNCLILWI